MLEGYDRRAPSLCKVLIALTLFASLGACGWGQEAAVKRFEQACRQEARTVVYDRRAWEAFKAANDEAFRSRTAKHPDSGGASIFEGTSEEFDFRYGDDGTEETPEPTGDGLHRSDITIYHNGAKIAKFIDFRSSYTGSLYGAPYTLHCTNRYPELYGLNPAGVESRQ
jgi:hypothetical protein